MVDANQLIKKYAGNNMKELKRISYPIFIKFGGIYGKDHDEFYSKANEELWKAANNFDEDKGVPFEPYLKTCLARKFKTQLTGMNRIKRKTDRDAISIETPIVGKNGTTSTIEDMVQSDFNIEEELSEEIGISGDEKIKEYIGTLSKKEKQIAELLSEGYSPGEIKEKLHLTENRYADYLKNMKRFDRMKILKQKEPDSDTENEEEDNMQTGTLEKSKEKQYSISSIIKKMDSGTFRFDHPTQRESGRWTSKMKGNLISDILQNNPLPAMIFAEQIVDGAVITWNLDGKQKASNIYEYYHDGFKVCKGIRRGIINYQSYVLDENGNRVLTENGIPTFEQREFDICNKKFSQLPEELQERFTDYTLQCTQYLNCSNEDIEYHICRYNEGKPMNGSEKGMGEIGTKYARLVKEIAAMPFFTDLGGYTMNEFNSGAVNRVVIESIMSSNFIDDWKKNQSAMCSYIKDNASEDVFNDFTDMVERLETVVTDNDEVANMFNSKDSFIWFGLFARFMNTGINDEEFVKFMAEFAQSLHTKEIGGVCFDDLCFNKETGKPQSTKDKYIVVGKIELLEKLMNEFLHINIEETHSETENNDMKGDTEEVIGEVVDRSVVEEIAPVATKYTELMKVFSDSIIMNSFKFGSDDEIAKKVNESVEIVKDTLGSTDPVEDVELYLSIMEDWIRDMFDTPVLDKELLPALIGTVGYSCVKEIDKEAQDWFSDFVSDDFKYNGINKTTYENYDYLTKNLSSYANVIGKLVS